MDHPRDRDPGYETWAEIYQEHGHELPLDRWFDYIGREGGSSTRPTIWPRSSAKRNRRPTCISAVTALGVAPKEAVAFEDSANGIAAAKDAGLLCVAVPNALTAGMDLSRADLRLGSLAETPLKRLLAVLSAL